MFIREVIPFYRRKVTEGFVFPEINPCYWFLWDFNMGKSWKLSKNFLAAGRRLLFGRSMCAIREHFALKGLRIWLETFGMVLKKLFLAPHTHTPHTNLPTHKTSKNAFFAKNCQKTLFFPVAAPFFLLISSISFQIISLKSSGWSQGWIQGQIEVTFFHVFPRFFHVFCQKT